MRVSVLTMDSGCDIRNESNLTKCLLETMCAAQTGFIQATGISSISSAKHIVVFGSDRVARLESLVCSLVDGTGTFVVCPNIIMAEEATTYSHVGTMADIYKRDVSKTTASSSWGVDFSPRLVRTSFDEKLHIDTRMHRIVGKPPVSVVGKLSAALQEQEIADLYNSGYYVEVDISSLNDDTKIKNKLRTLTSLLKPGQGITLGCSYNNPKLWETQFSAILGLCKEGVPIAGISIVDNVPPPSAFVNTIALLSTVGIRYVAFKPQDMEAIGQVVEIAQANGSFPVLLQWARCGDGTPFSFESFVRPLLETYGAIRSCANIALAVEFREQTVFNNPLSYVTGEWSMSFGCPPMPIDGVLLDSETYSQNRHLLNNVGSSKQNKNIGASMATALDSLYKRLATLVLASVYSSDISSVPIEEYIGDEPCAIPVPDDVQAKYLPTKHIFELSNDESKVPDHNIWLQVLSSGRKDWLRQLLMSPVVVQGTACAPNPIRLVMRPQPGQIVTLHIVDNAVTLVQINSKSDNSLCASIKHCSSSGDIVVTVYVLMKHVSKSIQFEYSYHPEHAFAPIQQHMDRLYNAMEDFYENVVCNVVGRLDHSETAACFTRCYDSSEPAVSNQWVQDFCHNVNSCIDFYGNCSDSNLRLPIEFVYFLSFWGSIRLLAAPAIGNYHLAYVPLYHRMELIGKVGSFCSNSEMDLRHSVDQLFNTPTGEQVTFSSVVSCNGKQVARTSSSFLAIGGFADTATTFNKVPGQTIIARLPTLKVVRGLERKDWFSYANLTIPPIEPGTLLEFCLDSVYRFKDIGVYSSINTTGSVMLLDPNGRRTHVADICLQKDMISKTDPVVEFLEQYAVMSGSCLFANDGYAMELPESTTSNPHINVLDSMREFMPICTDNNPVHSNSYFAGLYGIPGTVVHGIWVASAVRAVVDRHVLKGKTDRVRTYTAKVTGLAFPKEKLSVSIGYIGMANGLIQARGSSAKLDGTTVLDYDLEIEQPKTAYIFAGHQETPTVKTGMGLYEHSDAAKRVWDSADCFMLKVYGVPLLDIVRNNPTSVKVSFKSKRGRRILDTYISLKKDFLSASTCVLPGLCSDYQSYTFSSSDGVLSLLQFSQLVHAVDAMANVADMRSKGLIPENALFAGHSLGEIPALASFGKGLLSVAETVDIVFCRGLLLQSLINDKSRRGLNGANTSEINASLDSVLHTSKMGPYVESIRNKLQTHISASHVDLSALVDCYIPNLVGKPFELSKDYIESAYNATQSPALKHRIDSWQDIDCVDISEQKQIAVELVVELLAFQVANPVQWTSTQHHIASDQDVCRQITISSCTQTHDIAPEPYDGKECDYSKISSLHISRDKELVYYSRGDAF
ncbi:fatty acid synthase alpha subunit Lsd1 [Coemansia sp. BCRC 34490]|nr:fatty acid synthase alpha subunit Lsd1 [Coemansia sp. BCRC 34490]